MLHAVARKSWTIWHTDPTNQNFRSEPMARTIALIMTAALAWHGIAPAACAGDLPNAGTSKTNARDRDARQILRQIIVKTDAPRDCEFDTVWWPDAVLPHSLAKKEFGIGVEADLKPTYETGDFRSVVDPDRTIPDGKFCPSQFVDERARRALERTNQQDDVFVSRNRTLFGYPIFDAKRNKAAVMITHTDLPLWRNKGKVGEGPITMDYGAIIYIKVRGNWNFLRFHSLGMS